MMKKGLRYLLLVSALAPVAIQAVEFDDPVAAINYRQKTFEKIEDQLKMLKRSIKTSDNLATNNTLNLVNDINTQSQHLIAAFKPVSYKGKTKADSDIWEEWPRFEQLMGSYLNNLKDLENALRHNNKNQALTALKDTSRSCKSCHISYRDFW